MCNIPGAAYIELTQGRVAIVDASDLAFLNKHNWCFSKGYALRSTRPAVYMHRQLLHVDPGMQVDHIDGDKLNNRRSNLRIVTNQQNAWNMKGHSKSGFKGVVKTPQGKWCARIYISKRLVHLGTFDTAANAALRYNEAARRHYGIYARLNIVKTQ
jgi:hypothetical protein